LCKKFNPSNKASDLFSSETRKAYLTDPYQTLFREMTDLLESLPSLEYQESLDLAILYMFRGLSNHNLIQKTICILKTLGSEKNSSGKDNHLYIYFVITDKLLTDLLRSA